MAEYEDYTPEDDDYERESPEVYRRRRIITAVVALLVLLLLIGGVIFSVKKISASVGGQESTAAPTENNNFASFSARPTPSASSESEDEASDDPSASESASEDPSAVAEGEKQADAERTTEPAEEPAEPTAEPTEAPTEDQQPQACGAGLQVSVSVDQQSYAAGQNPQITTQVQQTGDNPCTVNLGSNNVQYLITSGPAQVFDSRTCQAEGTDQEALVRPGEPATTSLTWDRQMTAYGCGDARQPAQIGYYWVTATVDGVSSQPQLIIIQ